MKAIPAISFFFPCFLILNSYSEVLGLEKPKHLTAVYNSSSDKLIIQWDKVSGAGDYKTVVKDTNKKILVKSTTSSLSKKFAGSKFLEGAEYSVMVQSISGSSSSKFASKSYFHKRSRAVGEGALLTLNSFGRGGSYYLPPKFENKPKPLMVAYHGQGSAGDAMVGAFSKLAKEFGFIIVAPSSGLTPDGTPSWGVATLPGITTPDFNHVQDCIDEVLGFSNVKIDATHVLSVGHSAGTFMAPYFATNKTIFTQFALLHGGALITNFGNRFMPVWLSTGTNDTLSTPLEIKTTKATLEAIGFSEVIYTEFDSEHALTQKETRGLVEWWLNKK
jgi:predicted esterase